MSNDKRMEAVDEDEGDNLPVIERLHHLKLEVETSGPEDDFALPAEELKQYGGMTPVFKRKTTNQLKKFYTGEEDAGSKKIEEEAEFTGYQMLEVVEPPYNLEGLAKLYNEESSPHYAAVNAKVANIVGLGYNFVETAKTKRGFEKIVDDEEKVKKKRQQLEQHRDDILSRLDKFNAEDAFLEVLIKVWTDYEVTGNGYLEVGRKKNGEIGYIGHIPAQTMRIRRKRDGYVQISAYKVQYFANFGMGGVEKDDDGVPTGKAIPISNPIGGGQPNEVIHFKRYSPVSGFYGIPDIIAALPAIAGNKFAAQFNLDYFEHKAIPRHVIILKGAKLGNHAEKDLLEFFETNLKGQNHRSLYIPLPGDTEDNKVELKFETIEAGIQDSSFEKYRKANMSDILMVHRVPLSKISTADGASLAIARDADKTFKEQVCAPQQKIVEKKLNKIFAEITDTIEIKLNEMTLTDENTQSQIDERRRKTGIETANEQRARRGLPALEGGDELFDMNSAMHIAEMNIEATAAITDKQIKAQKENAQIAAQAKASTAANPAGTSRTTTATGTQRDSTRSANRTDSAGEARNPKGEGRTTA